MRECDDSVPHPNAPSVCWKLSKIGGKTGKNRTGLTRILEFTKAGKQRVRQLKIPLSNSPTKKKCGRRFPNLRPRFNPPVVEVL